MSSAEGQGVAYEPVLAFGRIRREALLAAS